MKQATSRTGEGAVVTGVSAGGGLAVTVRTCADGTGQRARLCPAPARCWHPVTLRPAGECLGVGQCDLLLGLLGGGFTHQPFLLRP